MAWIAAVAGVHPEHRYRQDVITDALADLMGLGADRAALLRRFHTATGVQHRYLARPIESYAGMRGFTETNRAFVEESTVLGGRALLAALERSGLRPDEVDVIFSTTVTGLAVPSLDARLVSRVGLRPDVVRVPLFGLGCVAGAAGIARATDYLLGHPDAVVVLVAVELCSLTFQLGDDSVANLIATGLFGDGAAAVVLVGDRRAGALGLVPGAGTPQVCGSRSTFYPDTEDTMGWEIGTTGFRVVLSAGVPDVVESHLAHDVKGFLSDAGLDSSDITHWIGHPGGPKVLETVARVLGLESGALQLSWDSMAGSGNMSSVSVLHVLERTLAERAPSAGSYGALFAMGPGFCSELVLLRC